MNHVKLICNTCKRDMMFVSRSGTTSNHTTKEIWDCPGCNMEVLVIMEVL